MFAALHTLFDTTGFTPRWDCGYWTAIHGWLHILADFAVAGAYFAIPCLLAYFVLRRHDLPFPPIFWLFAAFILTCGIGHAIEATLFWQPWYRLSGAVKVATALVSWATVVALVPLLPRALALPGLAAVNQQLKEEIQRREESEAERRKLESQMQLVQKLESLGVLAGGIAHDFNNLLTSILGFADLARMQTPLGSPTRPMLEQIITGATRAAELTNQMLAYSGKGRFVVQPLNLSELVDGMTQLLRVSRSKKCRLSQELAEQLPSLDGDATQLRQVVMNLVINASEAIGDQEGTITVRTGLRHLDRAELAETFLDDHLPDGHYVFVEVADTGCGMTSETVARIFDPFYTTKFVGRGLGLAAVLGIVRAHRGAIEVESTFGRGTTFRIYFPAAGPPTTEVAATTEAPIAELRQGTILVVDDEESVREVVRDLLEELGFEVVLAGDGREGVATFRQDPQRFMLVLLDMTMPGLDGIEAFREMRQHRGDVRAVLMSGFTEHTVRPRALDQGIAGFVQKPFRQDQLAREIRRVLDS